MTELNKIKNMKTVLITGATSGIGKATAELLAANNYNLIITGRRNKRLIELKNTLSKITNVEILNFDIRSKNEVYTAIDSLPENFKKIDVLINNAGLALGLSKVQDGDEADWEQMIDTNVKGMLYITKKVSQLMIKNNSGHIVNIGSIAGKEVYPFGNVYCSTKHAVDALTKAMRIDLLENNIKVSSIDPGMVDTEFSTVRFHGDKQKADNVYKGFTPLYAKDIADTILFVITRPSNVNINDLVIMPTVQASATIINKKL